MYENLIKYCKSFVEIDEASEEDLQSNFLPKKINKKEFLLKEGKICNMVAYVDKGTMRIFHTIDGNELTCDIILENSFVTDFKSLNNGEASAINIQAIDDCELLIIDKFDLIKLYDTNKHIERLGRIMAEKIAIRTIEIAASLSFDKPEMRFKKLLSTQPELFQKVPQKYLANILGISPESLSRIKARKNLT
jgi:CRP-like cAMP-binding protein